MFLDEGELFSSLFLNIERKEFDMREILLIVVFAVAWYRIGNIWAAAGIALAVWFCYFVICASLTINTRDINHWKDVPPAEPHDGNEGW
ncbi:hypothetical protein KKG08_01025 [Patescibacteria group bacterium]|nr:hypothetical protein [Patescibacteria group bacterium]